MIPFVAIALILNAPIIFGQNGIVIDPELRTFFGTLEPYVSAKNDIVFVLDASGSIGRGNFPHEVKFSELVSRMFTVSSEFTRVSVISYSSIIKTPIDYIKNSADNNMCTFLKDLKTVPYTGRNTNTAGALREAGIILRNARPKSSKIIILISDGKSSAEYGPPIPVAVELKTLGHIVFSIGVANVNRAELLAIATSPSHVYMLKNFKYIIEVNDQLRNDTKELVWDSAEPDLCNSYCSAAQDCCDANAACFCGTRGGRYECACQAGHQGNGHQGECKKCPFGTYKGSSGKELCKSCPTNSTTSVEGSTSIAECKCITGHSGRPQEGDPCKPITCNKLHSPTGGQIFPLNCGNIYDSVCAFNCHLGYCPYSCNSTSTNNNQPIESRKCLQSRIWSGPEFFCDKIICPALHIPLDGKYKCNSTDFSFFTQCNLTCNEGHKLKGSEQRVCLLSGKWTGQKTICEANKCPNLKINKNLKVKPAHCGTKAKPFRTTCQYYCINGFELETSSLSSGSNKGIRECLANGTWSNYKQKITCKDVTPPSIKCPLDLVIATDKHKLTAEVSWQVPSATDNGWVKALRLIHPLGIRGTTHHFPIGNNKVTYQATDSVGLQTTCSFFVKVIDTEAPQVEKCPSDIEVYHHKRTGKAVSWIEPKFIDNSGRIKTSYQNRKPDQLFTWGPAAEVIYNATDYSQNSASCKFLVKVKQYKCPYHSPPKHGSLTCDLWIEGQFCSVACPNGYNFVRKPEKVYYCYQRRGFGEWGPLLGLMFGTNTFQFPWPDCAKESSVSGVKLGLSSQYYIGSCPDSDSTKTEIAENFIKILNDEFAILGICDPSDGCDIQNVNITCSSSVSSNNRRKRDVSSNNLLSVNYDVIFKPTFLDKPQVNGSVNYTEQSAKIDSYLVRKVEEIKTNGAINVSTLSGNVIEDLRPVPNSIQVIDKPKVFCDIGSVLSENRCLICPEGTYHDPIQDICTDCPIGTYQDVPGALLCTKCPNSKTTLQVNSKIANDCKDLCNPGSYSSTGYESCSACDVGSFQLFSGAKNCIKCEEGYTTWTIGSYSAANCTKVCVEGTISDTGYEPCEKCPRGTYQSLQQQSECIPCKGNLTTLHNGAHIPQLCQAIDLCEEIKPCRNGGNCSENGSDLTCKCPLGFIGKSCEVNENDCFSDLCVNNGTCIDLVNDYKCICPEGYAGKNCQTDIDDCLPGVCANGGKCVDEINGFQCECSAGFNGKQCQVNLDDCSSNPCTNGGQCTDLNNDYKCCCPTGWSGKQCEKKVDPCIDQSCKNGASCVALNLQEHSCVCAPGFSGNKCQVDVNECASNLCANGAECTDHVNSFSCHCKPGYNGTLCDQALPSDFDLSYTGAYSSNYVLIENKAYLEEITVAFWMKTSDKTSRGTPLSYSYKTPDGRVEENALTFADYNKFIVSIHGEIIRTDIVGNRNSMWHSYVVTWKSTDGSWAIYVDGVKKNSGDGIAVNGKFWQGYFVLGQEQDSYGGTFSPTEAFVGHISQFNVWDQAMDADQVQSIGKKCSFYGNVIAWPDVLLNIHGEVATSKPSTFCTGGKKCANNDCGCSTNGDANICWKYLASCSPNPCLNGVKCIGQSSNKFICDCKGSYSGKLCQYDVNECDSNNGGCSHFCQNLPGSYLCTCPTNHVLNFDNRTCTDVTFCDVDGNYHLSGNSWNKGCEECKCKAGITVCSPKICQPLNCSKEEIISSLKTDCCPKCSPKPKSCTVSKMNKFLTFDGMEFWFKGYCRYILAQDSTSASFKIVMEYHNEYLREKSLYIHHNCQNLSISEFGNVVLNGLNATLPFFDDVFNAIEISGGLISVKLSNNIEVEWSKYGNVAIQLPHELRGKTNGLCGNFNDNYEDDRLTQQSLPARTILEFAHSWKLDGYKYCKAVPKKDLRSGIYPHFRMDGICKNLPMHVQLRAQRQCRILKSREFRSCYPVVSPWEYFQRCIQDACTCGFNEPCFCDAISSYTNSCRKKRISIVVQPPLSICRLKCGGGMVYDECGPSCPETCETMKEKNIGAKCKNANRCKPGCRCPAGFIIHQSKCIRPHLC